MILLYWALISVAWPSEPDWRSLRVENLRTGRLIELLPPDREETLLVVARSGCPACHALLHKIPGATVVIADALDSESDRLRALREFREIQDVGRIREPDVIRELSKAETPQVYRVRARGPTVRVAPSSIDSRTRHNGKPL